MSTSAPAVEARSLYRFFRAGDEETLALRGVSLAVEAGQIVVVVGPSGSGKSTLLSCLAGLDEPDGGTVLVGGERMSHRPEAVRSAMRARRIGVLTQSRNVFDHLTVRANVEFARAVSDDARSARVPDPLDVVGLTGRSGAYPDELSGGEAARAGLAVALAADPILLLADEPTGELDSRTEDQVLALLVATARQGVAVVIASHSAAVTAVADRVVHVRDGQIAA